MKYIKTTFLLLLFCSISSCKGDQIKKENSSEIVGSTIKFIKNDSKDKSAKKVYTNHFNLNKDKFLSIEFTLEKPLVKSLQELAPDISTKELLNKGNFQFSFLVNGKIIYVENLDKGAGLPESKTTQLTHTIPFANPEPLDFWGWFVWLKFMKLGGGRDALDTGNHTLTIEVRSYLNNGKLLKGTILARGNIDIDVEDLPFDKNLVPIQEIQPTQDWSLSKESYNHDKIKALNKKIAQGRFEKINGIVVIKNGKLLIEEYFNGSKRASLHDTRSVGKSIASTMMGIAIDEKYIKDENRKLKEFYDIKKYKNYSPKKEEVTIKSLLTMSSGFIGDDGDFNSLGNEEFMYPTKNWVQFTLDLPMDENKTIGENYNYISAGAVVLGDIIHKSVPNGLVRYADKKLFKPLNITNYKWQYTPQKVGNTAGGIQLRAIDFAKYGQLYKNKGNWKGKQLISENWIKKSLSKQIKQPNTTNGYYGYLFWNKTYTVNGKNYEVSFSTGNGGNKIFIFKNIPFVVVITASAYNLPYAHSDVDKMMVEYILPAVINP